MILHFYFKTSKQEHSFEVIPGKSSDLILNKKKLLEVRDFYKQKFKEKQLTQFNTDLDNNLKIILSLSEPNNPHNITMRDPSNTTIYYIQNNIGEYIKDTLLDSEKTREELKKKNKFVENLFRNSNDLNSKISSQTNGLYKEICDKLSSNSILCDQQNKNLDLIFSYKLRRNEKDEDIDTDWIEANHTLLLDILKKINYKNNNVNVILYVYFKGIFNGNQDDIHFPIKLGIQLNTQNFKNEEIQIELQLAQLKQTFKDQFKVNDDSTKFN